MVLMKQKNIERAIIYKTELKGQLLLLKFGDSCMRESYSSNTRF